MSNSDGTCTDPGTQTRDRSLRTRSTIIRFSDRSFSLARSADRKWWSSVGSADRGRVPLIGFDSTVPSAPIFKNRSGDALSTDIPANCRRAL